MTQKCNTDSLVNIRTVLTLTTPFLSYTIQNTCQPKAAVLPSKTFVDFGDPLHIFPARSAFVNLYKASSPMHLKKRVTLNQFEKHGQHYEILQGQRLHRVSPEKVGNRLSAHSPSDDGCIALRQRQGEPEQLGRADINQGSRESDIQAECVALIDGSPASYYERMGGGMKILDETIKNTIDMDMECVARSRPFNEDIVWVIEFVCAAIEAGYEVVVPKNQWVVLKCDYDVVKQVCRTDFILTFLISVRFLAKGPIHYLRENAARCHRELQNMVYIRKACML